MRIYLALLALLFITQPMLADENSKYKSAIKNALNQMEEAKNAEDFATVANVFERIAAAEKEKWEPLYYLAFIKTIGAFSATDKASAGEELETLTSRLSEALEYESVKENPIVLSEMHALLAMMYSAGMMADPMRLSAQFSPLNRRHLDMALTANGNNPRVHLLQAQNLFYTPEAFGGDKKQAQILAKRALELFREEEAMPTEGDNAFLPKWGKDQAESLLK